MDIIKPIAIGFNINKNSVILGFISNYIIVYK